jgi:hypothetical protein
MIGSRGKVHLSRGSLIRISTTGADVRRAERADATDGKRVPRRILQQAVEPAARQIVSRDKAAGSGRLSARKLADQQIVTEATEIERSKSDTPGSWARKGWAQPRRSLLPFSRFKRVVVWQPSNLVR